jgi:2-phospho-L-lactate guanylyltransferase
VGVWAVVPVKAADAAKTRLSGALSLAQRQALQRAMLAHVLGELGRCGAVERVVTVGPGRDWPELGDGVNETLRLARQRVPGAALVVNADLPLLRAEEVERAVREGIAADPAQPLLFASWDGEGTNGFLLPPGVPLLCSYGPGSLARHVEIYRRLGVTARPYHSPGLAADVDTPADLARCLLWQLGAEDEAAGPLAQG